MTYENNNTTKENNMNLPTYSQVSDSAIKSLININDLVRCGSTLKSIKAQAAINGFDLISKARSFSQVIKGVKQELTERGFVAI